MATTQVSTSVLKDGSVTSAKLDTNIAITGNLIVDTNTLYVNSSTNNVGIGTDSPSAKLSVHSAVNSTAMEIVPLTDENSADTSVIRLWGTKFGTTNRHSEIRNVTDGSTANNELAFNTNGTERMRIHSGGDISFRDTSANEAFYWDASTARLGIGIGASSPLNKIHITDTSAGNVTYPIRVENSGTTTGTDVGILFTTKTSGGGASTCVIRSESENTTGNNSLVFTTPSGGSSSERMRIDSSGNVGIGTNSPYTKLAINSGIARTSTAKTYSTFVHTNDSDDFRVGLATAEKGGAASADRYVSLEAASYQVSTNTFTGGIDLALNPLGGNVGIGTTSPSALLEVNVTGNNTAFILTRDTGTNGELTVNFQNANANFDSLQGGYTFKTAGTEQMRISSNGNIGINTSSSTYPLNVSQETTLTTFAAPVIMVSGKNASGYAIGAKHTIGFGYTTSVQPTVSIGAEITSSSGSTLADMVFATRALTTNTVPIERMRITSGGDVLFGGISSTPSSSVYGSAFIVGGSGLRQLFQSTSTTTAVSVQRFYNPNGNVGSIALSGSSTSYNETSDYRLKENVVPITGALDRVDALKPSRFNFIADADTTVDGFLAHELAEVVPEAVTGEKDAVDEEGNAIYQGIDKGKIVPLLVGAIQELRAEIETLKSQINN